MKTGHGRKKYQFTDEINKQLKGFNHYLQKPGNSRDTITQKMNYTGYFLTWLKREHLQIEETRYNDLLSFVDYCKLEDDSKALINKKIRGIRAFFEYIKMQTPNITNPAVNLNLRGSHKKVISGIIEYKELEGLYNNQKTNSNRDKRNKAILGLLIYQGITTRELKQLEPAHLKLKEGKIEIPGSRRSNSRMLDLKPFQILELHDYLTQIRPLVIQEITNPRPSRKPGEINQRQIESQLFISINGSDNIKSSLLHMFRVVQKTNPNITNAKQIRQSTITHWLKNNNLRQVQYMAGHKHVSSTEPYQENNLDSLKDKIDKCHPLDNEK